MYKQIKGFKMSMQNKLKNKILNNSDSYNYYKNKSDKLSNDLNKELKDLKKEFKEYKKNNDEIINSYNKLFNKIFLDFEIKPKGPLKSTHELCLKLLDFYVNICKKYDLEYWLDYGNLLGAIRHGGFIPWDDDLDVGMMRADILKFNEIIEKEVKLHNLDDIIRVRFVRRIRETRSPSFTEISIINEGVMYAGIDVFPCDYVKTPPENLEEKFKTAKKEYIKNVYTGMDKKEVIDKYYKFFNCSFEKQKYFLPSIEGPIGGKGYKVSLFETDKVFPLKEIEFEGKNYACPNDPHYFLSKIYGDNYMKIPKVLRYHARMDDLKKQENIIENFKYFSERMDKVIQNL